GDDLIEADEPERPVYISNYQKVAMILHGRTTILEPKKQIVQMKGEEVQPESAVDHNAVEDTVAVYQYASHWRDISRRIPSVLDNGTLALGRFGVHACQTRSDARLRPGPHPPYRCANKATVPQRLRNARSAPV
ncbi:hypothetical protein, partial [Mesorhizobium sp.]|uniref:hypothetical protein n=1 Tax=Mesorhizobium sp. TaxID=1871066 RepID=UPI002579F366